MTSSDVDDDVLFRPDPLELLKVLDVVMIVGCDDVQSTLAEPSFSNCSNFRSSLYSVVMLRGLSFLESGADGSLDSNTDGGGGGIDFTMIAPDPDVNRTVGTWGTISKLDLDRDEGETPTVDTTDDAGTAGIRSDWGSCYRDHIFEEIRIFVMMDEETSS